MRSYSDKSLENQQQSLSAGLSAGSHQGKSAHYVQDNRPALVVQKKQGYLIDNRPQAVVQRMQVQALANKSVSVPLLQKKENKTGLPDQLKSGIENLSGYSMNNVIVHCSSSQPAQLNAHAYAQGNQI